MNRVDLHTHTTYSDGTMSPGALVDLACKIGLKGIAITDHDTIEGVPEALEQGKICGIEVLSGIEISSWHRDIPMHILGYYVNHDDPILISRLEKLQFARHTRNLEILEKLDKLNIHINADDMQLMSGQGQCGRPHIARLLVEKGFVADVDVAFEKYLRKGAAAYAERFRYPADEAIRMIRDAGGIAVIAHPINIDPSLRKTLGLLKELQDVGLAGVEVYYPTHSIRAMKGLKKITEGLGLIITGGSDFHGDKKNGIPLGGVKPFLVPEYLLQEIKKLKEKY